MTCQASPRGPKRSADARSSGAAVAEVAGNVSGGRCLGARGRKLAITNFKDADVVWLHIAENFKEGSGRTLYNYTGPWP